MQASVNSFRLSLQQAARSPAGAKLSRKLAVRVSSMAGVQPQKVVIVGGVAGGASCAARLRRSVGLITAGDQNSETDRQRC